MGAIPGVIQQIRQNEAVYTAKEQLVLAKEMGVGTRKEDRPLFSLFQLLNGFAGNGGNGEMSPQDCAQLLSHFDYC